MASVRLPTEQRFLLDEVDWKSYLLFLRSFEGRHVRLTYDRGVLEIMTLSDLHERNSCLLDRFIGVVTEEMNIAIASFGSTTFKRKKRKRGLEPDQCYYIKNEALVRALSRIDLRRDPPPDLAVEVDVSHSSLDRLSIYAALGVPEVWRYDGTSLKVYHLTDRGTYAEADHSLNFPFLPLAEMIAFLHRRTRTDETSLVRAFRAWVREGIAKGWQAPA